MTVFEVPYWALLGIEPRSLPIQGSVLTTLLQDVDTPTVREWCGISSSFLLFLKFEVYFLLHTQAANQQ